MATKEIEIIRELVEAIRYTVVPRSNALNKAYEKAKEYLKEVDNKK